MKIKDIRNKITNETRADGRYPLRIGSEVELVASLKIGCPMFLGYITDKNGNPKEGTLRTSLVKNIKKTNTEMFVYTMNSIYIFEK